jgi:Protein kinase domain
VTSNPVYCIHNLKHVAVLGSGTFGRVSLVQEVYSKKIFALKAMLKTEIVAHKQQNNVLNEKNVMSVCRHPFILQLFQTFKDIRKLYMLFEFVQGGELFAVIHTARSDGKPGYHCNIPYICLFIFWRCYSLYAHEVILNIYSAWRDTLSRRYNLYFIPFYFLLLPFHFFFCFSILSIMQFILTAIQ